jgi:predicted HicB family RNase H-like nuclease
MVNTISLEPRPQLDRQVNIRISGSLHGKLELVANANNLRVSTLARRILEHWIAANIKTEETTNA